MSKSSLLASYKSFLEKTAATRALKIIRSLANAGKYTDAENFAKKLIQRGGLKTTPQGSQIRYLGGGAETPSHLVIGSKVPKNTQIDPAKLNVRKTISPYGALYSKESMGDAFNAMRRVSAPPNPTQAQKWRDLGVQNVPFGGHKFSRGNPHFSRLLSKKIHKTPKGGQYYHQEYVPNAMTMGDAQKRVGQGRFKFPPTGVTEKALESIRSSQQNLMAKSKLGDLLSPGWSSKITGKRGVRDWGGNPENVLFNKKTKLPKAVDFFVSPKDIDARELKRMAAVPKSSNVYRTQPTSHAYSRHQSDAGSRRAQILEDAADKVVDRRRALFRDQPEGYKGIKAALERMGKHLSKRQSAEYWRRMLPGAQTTVGDFVPTGIRKVDPVETLRLLGPGSPRVGKKVRGAMLKTSPRSRNQKLRRKGAANVDLRPSKKGGLIQRLKNAWESRLSKAKKSEKPQLSGKTTRKEGSEPAGPARAAMRKMESMRWKAALEKKKRRKTHPRTGIEWPQKKRVKTIPSGEPLTPSTPPGASRPKTVDPMANTHRGIGTDDTINLRSE